MLATGLKNRQSVHLPIAGTRFCFTGGSLGKTLWRGQEIFAQQLLSEVIRGSLLQMLDWYIGCRHDFNVNPGKWGKFYRRYLESDLYEKLVATYLHSIVKYSVIKTQQVSQQ